MKKLLTLVFAAITIGTAAAQLAIPGAVFADNPSRFNGRKVTLKEIKISANTISVNPAVVAPVQTGPVAIGPVGPSPVAPAVMNCRAPRGFKAVNITFNEKPEFKHCFFMIESMALNLSRETGGQEVDAQITFRGDSRTGYNVSFYKLGK